jgi:similar to stage IV sporulation protein
MLRRLINYLLGHLRIEVRSSQLELFLNLALAQSIHLWAIQRTSDRLRASLSIADFRALRPVARGAHARVHIIARYGLPFRVVRTRRRPVLIAGALACLGFVVWASSHVWVVQVKVTGPQNLDRRAVEAVAAEAGLKMGVWKNKVDTQQVQQHLQSRLGEISVAVVRMQGTRATVEVVEKATIHPTGQVGCVNLVARKEGVVERIIPFQGEPTIKKGDIVRAGDLLVECSFRYWQGGRPLVSPGMERPPRESIARTLVAQAQIKARISYNQYREWPLVRTEAVPTGKKTTRWLLKWGGRTILEVGSRDRPAGQVREVPKTYSLGSWRYFKSPVELVILNLEEVVVKSERIPLTQVLLTAQEQMRTQLRWILGPSDEVVVPIKAVVDHESKEYVGVRVTVETLEEIALPKTGAPVVLPTPAPSAP